MVGIYGTITEYMGTAYTGNGVAHKYTELMQEANKTIFLKCPPTHALSQVLNDIAMHFVKRGHDVDRFMNPGHADQTDAIYVKGLSVLILQASHPISFEPTDLGGRHKVFCFYDVYHEEQLVECNKDVGVKLEEAQNCFAKALEALKDAKGVHDEWERVNIQRMDWKQHEQLTQSIKEELFGLMQLHKPSNVSHRIIGSLSSGGAHDFIPSITKRMKRRMLIKGLPGTGKSTMMRALGEEAERRGFDVLYGWCGLDPASIDLILFPELSVCMFDATKPHAYDPDNPRDELVDLVPMCRKDEQAEKAIEEISERYRHRIQDAAGYMQSHVQAKNSVKILMDRALDVEAFEKKLQELYRLVKPWGGN